VKAAANEVVLIELDERGMVGAEQVALGVGRGMRTVAGSLEDLVRFEVDLDNWVRVELTDAERPVDAARRLRPVFPHLVEAAWTGGRHTLSNTVTVDDVRRRTPGELAADFWIDVTGEPLPADVAAALADVLADEIRRAEEAA
jgi:hypothetical protein